MLKNKKFQIDFIGNRKKIYTISAILMLIVIVSTFVFGVQLDIKFRGGTIINYSYEGKTGAVDLDKVDSITEETLGDSVTVAEKYNRMTKKNGFEITLASNKSVSSDVQTKLDTKLTDNFKDQQLKKVSVTTVNATMGREFFIKCLIAVAIGSLLMILYIGIRFRKIGGVSAGIFAVVALLHDVMIVFGTFVIARIPINDNFIAVVLTILGYSINSTIVIYDRIRENNNLYKKTKPLGEIVNLSVNGTLARSINSSLTTITAMIVVCIVTSIMGVTSIISFAFPIIMGLLSGAYTSSCLASELWVTWKERGNKKN